jgi:UDP-N-acetylmuramate dehydrogenase
MGSRRISDCIDEKMTDVKIKYFQELRQVFRGEIKTNEPLSKHTSFRIGGPADFYLYPKDLEDLSTAVDFAQNNKLSKFVIGNGTNLLVSDDGLRGLVIDLSQAFYEIESKENSVTAGAGVDLEELIHYCAERGLSGLEPLIGIPGQVGGGIILNAGAFDTEVSDRLSSVRLMDRFGTLEKKRKSELTFGYRMAGIPKDAIVVDASFLLKEGNPKDMEISQNNFLRKRKEKQPLSLPSAGSVFKRPVGDYAGRLIEEAGCKGLRIGDAMVSRKHANFIVNCRLASAQDVLRLIDEVRERVMKQFQVELELEIHMIGFKKI